MANNRQIVNKNQTAVARYPVYKDTLLQTSVRRCNFFISCYLDLRQRNTVLIFIQRITNQGSVDVSCLSLFPTIFKISLEHILN